MLRPAFWLALGTVMMVSSSLDAQTRSADSVAFALVLHGGAGSAPSRWSTEQQNARRQALAAALQIGERILDEGGSSLDAVEQVVRFMEDEPLFNAGRGSVFNAEGKHELDASIMDGKDLSCGGVAGVRVVKNPITLARHVMQHTRHVLLIAEGAEQFARRRQLELVPPDYFSTDAMRHQWERTRQAQQEDDADHKGTVGCVALDRHGNLAAGTSTGGLTNKQAGRVGDSPLIGAGTYADNRACAVSGTGVGEQFIRHAVAYDVAARMQYAGQTLEEAVRRILSERLQPGDGGVIAVSREGEVTAQYNTGGMSYAACRVFSDPQRTAYRVVSLGEK